MAVTVAAVTVAAVMAMEGAAMEETEVVAMVVAEGEVTVVEEVLVRRSRLFEGRCSRLGRTLSNAQLSHAGREPVRLRHSDAIWRLTQSGLMRRIK